MMPWVLVGGVVAFTTASDLLQSHAMRHGKQARKLPLAIVCMAASFFSFLMLLRISDLSFAVPATAASYVVETLLAAWLLKERVDARRWMGALLVACGVALLAH